MPARPIEKDPNSSLVALYVSGLEWFTSDQDLESLVNESGQRYIAYSNNVISDSFLPLELSFKEDKINGKSKCEAFLKFSNHDAAVKAKNHIEKCTSFKITFANLGSKPNPFRETPNDSSQVENHQRQERSHQGYDQRQQYNDHAYMARFYQQAGRDGRMARNGQQSYQFNPYQDSRASHDSRSRRRSRERRNSNETRDPRDYRKY